MDHGSGNILKSGVADLALRVARQSMTGTVEGQGMS